MLCIVAIADCTHVEHVVQNIRTYKTLLLLLTAPKFSYSFFEGLGNIAQDNSRANILTEDLLWPPIDMVMVYPEQDLDKLNR